MVESLHRKFQEIARRTSPTGDPNCPPYIIKTKQINRQLVQIIDALSGGLEAKRSEGGLSDASDSEDTGAGEFANVINKMNNTPGNGIGGGEEADEEEDTNDDGGQPDVAGNGVTAAVAMVVPPDGVAPAVAGPSGRGPGRSHTLPASAAGVIGPPPAPAPPAAVVAAPPAAAVARNTTSSEWKEETPQR